VTFERLSGLQPIQYPLLILLGVIDGSMFNEVFLSSFNIVSVFALFLGWASNYLNV
jgi:hypothetical protein